LLFMSRLPASAAAGAIMSRTILVTGATGTVSRALIDVLKTSRSALQKLTMKVKGG
jgi:FlaA1/EpsC-like NDP-sugar epimerase